MTWHRQDLSAWRVILQLVTLWGFAIAQPLYDLLGRQPAFLVAHRATPGTIIAILLVLSLALPLLLVAAEVLAGVLSQKVGWVLHLALIWILVALTVLAPFRRAATTVPTAVLLGLAAGVGLAFTSVYARWPPLRSFLTVLAPAALVFPMYFAFFTPARHILFPRSEFFGAPPGGRPLPIVLVVFDELNLPSLLDEKGEIDSIRYPNFARLAQSSWWFPHATATSPLTERAIPAILTGRYPRPDPAAVPTAGYFHENLFTWLGKDRPTHAVEVLTALCPPSFCGSMPAAERDAAARARELARDLLIVYLHQVTPPELAKRKLPPLEGTWRGFARANDSIQPSPPAPEENRSEFMRRAIDRFRLQVQSEDRGDEFMAAVGHAGRARSLTFIHSLLPHTPWEHLPSGLRYTFQAPDLPVGVEAEVWLDEPHLVRSGYHRYLLQLAFVDQLIGKLLDHLQVSDSYDDSLLIITADHGVCFQAGEPRRSVSSRNMPEIVRVPLFIKLPGQREGRVSDRLASGVDIVPTIADALDADLPWQSDGASLLAPGFPARGRVHVDGKELEPAAVLAPTPSWQREAFPPRVPASQLVPVGPHYSALAGRLVRDIPVRQFPRPLQLRSSDALLLAGTKPLPGFLPAILRGEVLGGSGALTVAVAVNDRVQATVETFPWQGMEHYFSIVLPEAAFKSNTRNEVRAFLVDENAGELFLVPVPWEERTSYRLVGSAQGTKLVDHLDRELRIAAPTFKLRYSLDRYYARAGVVGFIGWVGDLSSIRPPTRIVVTLEDVSLFASEPNVERPEVAKLFGAPLVMSGYSFELPQEPFLAALKRDPRLESLRFFALFGEQAVELRIPPDRKQQLANSLLGSHRTPGQD